MPAAATGADVDPRIPAGRASAVECTGTLTARTASAVECTGTLAARTASAVECTGTRAARTATAVEYTGTRAARTATAVEYTGTLTARTASPVECTGNPDRATQRRRSAERTSTPQGLSHPSRTVGTMQPSDSDLGDRPPASTRRHAADAPARITPAAPPDATTVTASTVGGCYAAPVPGQSSAPGALSHPPSNVVTMHHTDSDPGDRPPASTRRHAADAPARITPAAPPDATTVPTVGGCSAAPVPGQSSAPGALSHPPSTVVDMQPSDSDLGDRPPASTRHRSADTPSRGTPSTRTATAGCPTDGLAAEQGSLGESVAGGVGDCPVGALGVLLGDPDALDAAGLGAFLGAVRSVRSWVDAREAAALRAAVRCEAAREAGAADAAAWLGQHTGVGRREALARERTAAGLADLPEVSEALADGRLTLGHAQVLTQFAAPAGVDLGVADGVDFPDPVRDAARRVAEAVRARPEELIAAAESTSVDAFRRFLRRWADRVAGDDGAGRDIAQRRGRRVSVFETDDGMRGVRGLLPADQFALFENELRRLAEARWRADHPDADNVPAKELTCPQRNADALVDMARRSRQLGDNHDEPLGSHIDVMVLIDHQTLTAGLHDEGRCELDDNTPISPVAARRMLCDADIIAAIGDPAALRGTGAPHGSAGNGVLWGTGDRTSWRLDLGYSRRAANRKIRKALIARDRTCTAPGCERPHWMCEIHHIVPWAEGGRTDLNNLTLLCSRHHHLHHANEGRRTDHPRTPNGMDAPPSRPPEPGNNATESSRTDQSRTPNGMDAPPSRPPEPGNNATGEGVATHAHGIAPHACRPSIGAPDGRGTRRAS